jgi:WD40 repeat protein
MRPAAEICVGRLSSVDWPAAGSNKGVHTNIWDASTGIVVKELLNEPGSNCASLKFTPDGNYLAEIINTGHIERENIIVWNTNDWSIHWSVRTSPFLPKKMAMSPDGKYLAIGGIEIRNARPPYYPQIRLLSINDGSTIEKIDAFPENNNISALSWDASGTKIAVGALAGTKGN